MMTQYEAVIGLEIHVQLNSPTKMFCDCPNAPGHHPNAHTCPICLWMPGAVPQFSQTVLEHAVTVCLALNAEIQEFSRFDQKVYYYPDLPKGFQLSQHHHPLSRHGWVDILDEAGKPKRLRLHHIHMEEDVAKLVHETEGHTKISLVDFNRAGAPLVEIVTEPDIRTPFEAMEFLRCLRAQIRYSGAAECSMENGTMRCDANISLRRAGTDEMNTKVEVKNMNSVRAVGNAIAYEMTRQAELLEQGKPIVLHTRLWDPDKNITTPMRGKFSGPCVPDPGVPPIELTQDWIAGMKTRLPEMPEQKRERFVRQYGIKDDEAVLISAEIETAEYFEDLVRQGATPRTGVQWITARLLPVLKERNQAMAQCRITPRRLAELLALTEREEISQNAAREVFAFMLDSDQSAAELIEKHGLKQIGDTQALESMVEDIMAAHPDAVADFRNGKNQALSFLIGQIMRSSQGKANPKVIKELLAEKMK